MIFIPLSPHVAAPVSFPLRDVLLNLLHDPTTSLARFTYPPSDAPSAIRALPLRTPLISAFIDHERHHLSSWCWAEAPTTVVLLHYMPRRLRITRISTL